MATGENKSRIKSIKSNELNSFKWCTNTAITGLDDDNNNNNNNNNKL